MDAFTVLADPTRRKIIESLSTGESSFGEIADQFTISRPAVSQHLKVLRDAEIVTVRANAQRRIYRLSDNGLDPVDQWLQGVRRMWASRLDRLEHALSKEEADNE